MYYSIHSNALFNHGQVGGYSVVLLTGQSGHRIPDKPASSHGLMVCVQYSVHNM